MIGSIPRSSLAAIVAVMALVLTACGGSGTVSNTEVAGGTGNVAVLITDDPTLLYNEINVTITEISLIPSEDAADPAPVVLFEGEAIIDLLQLRDYSELFTVAEGVPVDDYEKVRLKVSSVELVDTDTNPPTVAQATLPGDAMDLVPAGSLQVTGGETLFLEIDIDAENSLLIVEGDTGTLIFRPVVFLATYEEGGPRNDNGAPANGDDETGVRERAPLLSVSGLLRVDESDRLRICPSAQAALPACVRLALTDDSAVFDSTGVAVDADALTEGVRLIAMGLLTRDPDDGRRVLEALSAVLGTRPHIGTRGGAADSEVDEAGRFLLRDGLTVELAEQTPVVDTAGTRLDREAIVEGQGMTIMGIMGTEPLAATLVVLRGDTAAMEGDGNGLNGEPAPPVVVLTGDLVSVDGPDTLQMEVDGQARSVRLAAEGRVVISGLGSVGPGDLASLDDHERVRLIARGSEGESYFDAEQIVAVILGRNDRIGVGNGLGVGGPPGDVGPPENAGPPENVGPPGHAGPSF